MRADNGVFHRQCRSQRAREYSSCGIFIELPMQGCAYIWVVWEGRMSTTHLALSGIREVFPKTGGSHFNKYGIIWSRIFSFCSFCCWTERLFRFFQAQLFELHVFQISLCVLRAGSVFFFKVPKWKTVLSSKLRIGFVTLRVITQNRLRWRERQRGRPPLPWQQRGPALLSNIELVSASMLFQLGSE